MHRRLLILFWITAAVRVAADPSLDLDRIRTLVELNRSLSFDSTDEIEDEWSSRIDIWAVRVVDDTRIRYLCGIDTSSGHQLIAIRGTSNLDNVILDFQIEKRWSPELQAYVHAGFDTAARSVYADVIARLSSDRPVSLTGHSLGAATAVLLAKRLEADGFEIGRLITFGQPKFTDRQGAEQFSHLPMLRVVNRFDMIPRLPPPGVGIGALETAVHVGPELLLLDCDRYALIDSTPEQERLEREYWRSSFTSLLVDGPADHLPGRYLEHLPTQAEEWSPIEFSTLEALVAIECE